MITMEELQEAWNKVFESMGKLAKVLNNVFRQMYGSEERERKFCTRRFNSTFYTTK